MKKLELIQTPISEDAMAEIYRYSLDEWGEKQADAYLDELEKMFDMLCCNPNLGQNYPDIPVVYRVFPVNKHWIVYRASASKLFIVAIVNMAMDIENRLNELLKNEKP